MFPRNEWLARPHLPSFSRCIIWHPNGSKQVCPISSKDKYTRKNARAQQHHAACNDDYRPLHSSNSQLTYLKTCFTIKYAYCSSPATTVADNAVYQVPLYPFYYTVDTIIRLEVLGRYKVPLRDVGTKRLPKFLHAREAMIAVPVGRRQECR